MYLETRLNVSVEAQFPCRRWAVKCECLSTCKGWTCKTDQPFTKAYICCSRATGLEKAISIHLLLYILLWAYIINAPHVITWLWKRGAKPVWHQRISLPVIKGMCPVLLEEPAENPGVTRTLLQGGVRRLVYKKCWGEGWVDWRLQRPW